MYVPECINHFLGLKLHWLSYKTHFANKHHLLSKNRLHATETKLLFESKLLLVSKNTVSTLCITKKNLLLSFSTTINYILTLCAGCTQPAQSTRFTGVEVGGVEAVLLFLIQGGQSGNGIFLPNICCKSHIFIACLKLLLFHSRSYTKRNARYRAHCWISACLHCSSKKKITSLIFPRCNAAQATSFIWV